ncbi:MAG: MFS transporter [Deltaproteobacteria bacterium]|nr:MFS transporter [Deltaproteobacteria bacterium]
MRCRSATRDAGTEKRRIRLPRNVVMLGLTSLLTDVSSDMIIPLLPVFLTTMLGVTPRFVGLIEGVADSTASVLRLMAGWLSDRMGHRKPLVVWGYSVAAVARPLVALATAGWHVLLIRFLDRIGKGVRGAPRDALIADSTPAKYRGRAYGFHRALDHLGAVVGPFIAFVLLTWGLSYRAIFALAAIPGVLAIVLVTVAVREPPLQTPQRATLPSLSLKPFHRAFKAFLLILLIFTLGNSSDAFLLLRAQTVGIPSPLLPVLWLVLHAVKSLASLPGGMWSDRVGRKRVILIGWSVYAAIYLGLAFAQAPWHLWALFTIYGFYFGLTEASEKALVADLVSAELHGIAFGLYNMATGVMMLPASVLMGVMWHHIGVPAAFGTGAALAGAASILLALLVRPPPGARAI